jgi:hypothetical protein
MKFPLSPKHCCLSIYTRLNILIFTVISIADTNIFAVNDIPTAKMASKLAWRDADASLTGVSALSVTAGQSISPWRASV